MMYLRKLSIFIFTILLLVGCAQNKDDNALETKEAENPYVQVKNSDPKTPQAELSNTEIANHLAHVASNVPEVNDAAAVVAGPYAVVGIDVDKDIDRSRVGTIKYTVSEALYHDPYGKTAVVVADADIMERIRGMSDKIAQGQPVSGIIDELAAIVARYMPDFPIIDNVPENPDQNKDVIPDRKEEKLEEIQEEQSNHRMRE